MVRKTTAKTSASEASDRISEKLNKALDGLRKDVTRVEIWATALATFAQPVPEYRPDPKYLLRRSPETENFEPPATRPADKNQNAGRAKGRRKKAQNSAVTRAIFSPSSGLEIL